MMFHLLSSDRLKVTLTAQDARKLEIEWDALDPAGLRQLKRCLLRLLAEAQTKIGVFSVSQRLIIEIHPDDEGGAIVYFCADLPAERGEDQAECFCFYDVEVLLEAVARLTPLYGHRLRESALYRCGVLWWLIIRPMDGSDSPAARLLSEYADCSTSGGFHAAAIEEHGAAILLQHAADTLFYYFAASRDC